MPRLTFDLTPVAHWADRDDETRDRHNADVRASFARIGLPGEPRPCDCGFYAPTKAPILSYCGEDRTRCRENLEKRLEHHHRQVHLGTLRARRLPPRPRHDKAAKGSCRWCGEAIFKPGPSPRDVDRRRNWHDGRREEPNCLWEYGSYTDPDIQRVALMERDGLRCADCGEIHGGMAKTEPTMSWGRTMEESAPKWPVTAEGWEFCRTWSFVSMEIEHRIPLFKVAMMVDLDTEARRWFFGLGNLALVCPPCHRKKSAAEAAERAAMRRSRFDP